MEINEDMIKHVADIARLNLTEEEIKRFTPQLKEVIESFSKLAKENTRGIKPSFQPIDIKNNMRDDKPGICLSQEKALENAGHKKDGYFQGPKAV